MSEPVLRIHFLVPDPDGPLKGKAQGAPVQINQVQNYRTACGQLVFDEWNRATGEPWGVRCKACMVSEDYKRLYRPKPGTRVPDRTEETGPHGGCGCS